MKSVYEPNLGLGWDEDGNPVADSRRVADRFAKRHADLLESINSLNGKFRSMKRNPTDYFRPQLYRDPILVRPD